ncbi:hypothetical protein GUA87_16905 [Sneathiella sp. P13V-1]|uniref:SspB family protein n=1 Tax=Sneathiella sp. P13V-1 TaxID=2697366 RepID=UPI00187B417C|nr:ClpXP protease specificity-enhancing factor SspB [Sneathiella sp. P13V-1]MBE7638539.1 hypothetical protein [Sneathiella sp. P13V-1]
MKVTDGDFNYNILVEQALMDVVRKTLSHVAETGLVGQQHFYITFKTHFPGVAIPNHLRERYKDEMTIVMQHQYWDLTVDQEKFSIGLSFNHQRETLVIPFEAVTAFADPSVQFGLQFNVSEEDLEMDAALEEEDAPLDQPTEEPSEEATKSDDENKQGEVIALDAFRNK